MVPLQLKNYFFTDISIKVNPHFNPNIDNPDGELGLNVSVTPHEQEKNLFQVDLEIRLEPKEDKNIFPYQIKLVTVGIFEVSPKWPKEEVMDLLKITGASILYSAAREFLLIITSRLPWKPVMLPTVSFTHLKNKSSQ
ncbi:MAG: protein-export chaperone SecB [Candidatus Desulfofervidus auxilii]|nr:protein-export chaperone SecB [Candidatus Desulfofervidus auxilii]